MAEKTLKSFCVTSFIWRLWSEVDDCGYYGYYVSNGVFKIVVFSSSNQTAANWAFCKVKNSAHFKLKRMVELWKAELNQLEAILLFVSTRNAIDPRIGVDSSFRIFLESQYAFITIAEILFPKEQFHSHLQIGTVITKSSTFLTVLIESEWSLAIEF